MDAPMIKIGNDLTNDNVTNTKDALVDLYKSAFEYRISDKVLLASIECLTDSASIDNVTISDCNLSNK